jgi:hypothetical protein
LGGAIQQFLSNDDWKTKCRGSEFQKHKKLSLLAQQDRGGVSRLVLSTNCRLAPIWYQNIDSLETAGHHEEAVASHRLPVANEKQLQKNGVSAKRAPDCASVPRAKQRSVAEPLDLKTAFENAGFHNPLGSLKICFGQHGEDTATWPLELFFTTHPPLVCI